MDREVCGDGDQSRRGEGGERACAAPYIVPVCVPSFFEVPGEGPLLWKFHARAKSSQVSPDADFVLRPPLGVLLPCQD